jgi:predicted nucleic acid-binding protein
MLLDTSGLFSYFDDRDHAHDAAMSLFAAAPALLTHSYVLAELVPLFQKRGVDRISSLAFHESLLRSPEVEIVWVTPEVHRTALTLLRSRRDKEYSLCDAVSFLLMRERGITDALTTDRHFEQEGFVRLLKP